MKISGYANAKSLPLRPAGHSQKPKKRKPDSDSFGGGSAPRELLHFTAHLLVLVPGPVIYRKETGRRFILRL